jgi:hypothetical protein
VKKFYALAQLAGIMAEFTPAESAQPTLGLSGARSVAVIAPLSSLNSKGAIVGTGIPISAPTITPLLSTIPLSADLNFKGGIPITPLTPMLLLSIEIQAGPCLETSSPQCLFPPHQARLHSGLISFRTGENEDKIPDNAGPQHRVNKVFWLRFHSLPSSAFV